MKIVFFGTFIFLFFFLFSCRQTSGEMASVAEIKAAQKSSDKKEDCVTMKFHYLITGDSMRSETLRRIDVFLDKKAFTEENLKTLFTYLSDKNPAPNPSVERNDLVIFVETDWEQLSYPSDCPPVAKSGGDSGRDRYDYHFAGFYRSKENAFFHYNPVLKTAKMTEVLIKGTKIFANGQWQEKRN